jgi:nicotinamide mononucleotide (NMN) deamidase PncC
LNQKESRIAQLDNHPQQDAQPTILLSATQTKGPAGKGTKQAAGDVSIADENTNKKNQITEKQRNRETEKQHKQQNDNKVYLNQKESRIAQLDNQPQQDAQPTILLSATRNK